VPYAQIDVSAPRHHKVAMLSDAAFRLWVTALCYCQEHLTDGHIHRGALVVMNHGRIKKTVVEELVAQSLWVADDRGWVVHDYLAWNDSREKVEARRAKWRQRRGRHTPETPTCTPAGTPASVPSSVSGTQRNATQRSTDQEQKEHRPDGRTPRLRTTPTDEPPKPKLLAAIAQDLLKHDPGLDGADLKEALKSRAAALRVAYDGDSVRRALDGVQTYQQQAAVRR